MKRTTLNVSLLRKIQKKILKEPGQFNMDYWFQSEDSVGNPATNCGTAACIAGWAITIAARKNPVSVKHNIWEVGQTASGLLRLPPRVAHSSIFLSSHWPSEFRNRYDRAKTAKQAASAASDFIDYFIKKYSKA